MNTAVATGNTGLVRALLCFAVFEAAWFACVGGAAHGAMGWGIAAVIFSIGLQLAFSGAARMGACAFPEPVTALCVLAVGWGVILPSLLRLARAMDRHAR